MSLLWLPIQLTTIARIHLLLHFIFSVLLSIIDEIVSVYHADLVYVHIVKGLLSSNWHIHHLIHFSLFFW